MHCFGWFSKLDVTEVVTNGAAEEDEDAQRLRKYEEQMGADISDERFSSEETLVKKSTLDFARNWFCYDVRARILFGTIFAIFVGVGLPLIIYFASKPGGPPTIYGSCFLKQEYRVRCLPNQLIAPTESDCLAAKCCWNGNSTLPFNCFHPLASAYQYYVSNLETNPSEYTQLENLEINLRPNLPDRLFPLRVQIEWMSQEHLNVRIFDPEKQQRSIKRKIKSSNPRDGYSETSEFILNYATMNEFWFLKIERNATRQVIFDTRLGPLIGNQDYMEFTVGLGSRWFWGLKGGFTGVDDIFSNFNSLDGSEFPFYMSYESETGFVHGLLIDTQLPFLTQYLEAPGLMFHVENADELNLNFFVGPTAGDVQRQLNNYLRSKIEESTPKRQIPPYWALGLHLCRKSNDHIDALEQMQLLKSKSILYDSDCISEDFRTPFAIDHDRYTEEGIEAIFKHLNENGLKVLLNQKITLEQMDNNSGGPLIMLNSTHPFIGRLDSSEKPVYYPDYLDFTIEEWLRDEFGSFNSSEIYGGLTLFENYPLTFNSSGLCEIEEGKIQTRLVKDFIANSDSNFGLICPDAVHQNGAQHYKLHNSYGHESAVKLRAAFEDNLEAEHKNQQRHVFTSSSILPQTSSSNSIGYNGPEFGFSWDGLVESLTYLMRNWMFLSFTGTPICGSSEGDFATMDSIDMNELCFRWFQLGLLLPFARSSGGRDDTPGILDLATSYQNRVVRNTKERYKYNPYYYTIFYEESLDENGGEPPIRPILYEFPSSAASNLTFRISTQFMIGSALMAVPIVTRSSLREAYFPPGQWYNLAGKLQWSNELDGGWLQVDGFVFELPLYLRGGYIIPTLEEPLPSGNAMGTLATGKFSLISTYPNEMVPVSNGHLFMDDGSEFDSITNEHYDLLEFEMDNSTLTVTMVKCGLQPNAPISRTLNQVKIFGFPELELEGIELSLDNQIGEPITDFSFDTENSVLFIKNLNLDWCTDFHNQILIEWIFKEMED